MSKESTVPCGETSIVTSMSRPIPILRKMVWKPCVVELLVIGDFPAARLHLRRCIFTPCEGYTNNPVSVLLVDERVNRLMMMP